MIISLYYLDEAVLTLKWIQFFKPNIGCIADRLLMPSLLPY